MFVKALNDLTLSSRVANNTFPNITEQSWFMGDKSFLATMRALLYERVPAEESVDIRLSVSGYNSYEINHASPRDCVRAYLRNTSVFNGVHGSFHIHNFRGDNDGNEACFSTLDKGGVQKALGDSYTELADVSKFLEQNGKVRNRVYISEERKSVLIFVENLDMKRWHLLQSMIPRYMPWYFGDNCKPLDEVEMGILRSLTKRYAPDYVDLIEEFAKRFDFRTEGIRSMLRGFENYFEQNELENVRRDLNAERGRIADLNRRFQELYQRISDLNIKEIGLIEKIRNNGAVDGDTELVEYFLCNKSLEIVYAERGEIEFIVHTVASNYDPEVAERALERFGKSFFYRHYQTNYRYDNKEMTDERIKKLFTALFIDEKLKLRLCAAYHLNFVTGSYDGLSYYDFPEKTTKTHTPNQHIQHYGCLGNNRQTIADAMLKRDYVSAVSACCASATNINFTEANTGTFFMERVLSEDPGSIIQMPDGTNKTPLEAVIWLEENEKEEANE